MQAPHSTDKKFCSISHCERTFIEILRFAKSAKYTNASILRCPAFAWLC